MQTNTGPNRFSVYAAISPTGRIMQVWGTPLTQFPEVIATDYPDPDTCTTNLLLSTHSYTEAFRTWQANATALRTTCTALGTSFHTLNAFLED